MEKVKQHGGRRDGAGRKPAEGKPRPQNQIRAYPEEMELIRKFAKIVRSDIGQARKLLEGEKKMKYVVYGTAVVAVEKEIEASSLEEAIRLANEDAVIDVSVDGQALSADCVTDLQFKEGNLAE